MLCTQVVDTGWPCRASSAVVNSSLRRDLPLLRDITFDVKYALACCLLKLAKLYICICSAKANTQKSILQTLSTRLPCLKECYTSAMSSEELCLQLQALCSDLACILVCPRKQLSDLEDESTHDACTCKHVT